MLLTRKTIAGVIIDEEKGCGHYYGVGKKVRSRYFKEMISSARFMSRAYDAPAPECNRVYEDVVQFTNKLKSALSDKCNV